MQGAPVAAAVNHAESLCPLDACGQAPRSCSRGGGGWQTHECTRTASTAATAHFNTEIWYYNSLRLLRGAPGTVTAPRRMAPFSSGSCCFSRQRRLFHMKVDAVHAKAQLQAASGGKARGAVASSIAKPEFKKHIHTNNAKNKTGECEGAGAEVMSRRQLKNLAKRKKKEAAAAAAANDSSSSAVLPPSSTSAPAGGASAPAKAKKAPLDPGKKAEVNCNWQALKKALVSGGPLVTGSVLGVQFSLAPHSRPTPPLRPRHRG